MNVYQFEYVLIKLKKSVYQYLRSKNDEKQIVYIMGCQRSGTTLISEIFNRDLNSKVFNEHSELSNFDTDKIRLRLNTPIINEKDIFKYNIHNRVPAK